MKIYVAPCLLVVRCNSLLELLCSLSLCKQNFRKSLTIDHRFAHVNKKAREGHEFSIISLFYVLLH
jgi:hypothetical protein